MVYQVTSSALMLKIAPTYLSHSKFNKFSSAVNRLLIASSIIVITVFWHYLVLQSSLSINTSKRIILCPSYSSNCNLFIYLFIYKYAHCQTILSNSNPPPFNCYLNYRLCSSWAPFYPPPDQSWGSKAGLLLLQPLPPCASPDSLAESNCYCCYYSGCCDAIDVAAANGAPTRTCRRTTQISPGPTY